MNQIYDENTGEDLFNIDLEEIFKPIWNEFIYGGHLFAAGAMCVVYMCAFLFDLPVTWDLLFIIYLIFYPIYLYDYFKGIEEDRASNSQRAEYLQGNKTRILSMILYLSIITLALMYVVYSNIINMFIGFSVLVLGLLYHSYFKGLTRHIVAFKNIFVSAVWALLVFVPFVYYSCPITMSAVIVALFVFLKMISIQILFDMRDVEGDRAQGLLTIPIVICGKELPVLKALNIFTASIVAMGVLYHVIPLSAIMLFFAFAYTLNYIDRVTLSRKDYGSYFLAAGEPILWLFLIVSGSVFFGMLSSVIPLPFVC